MIIRTIGIVRQIEVEFHRAAARCLGDVEIAAGTIGLIGARCIAEREKKLPAKRPHLGNFKYEQSVADSVQFKIRVSVFNIPLLLAIVGGKHHRFLILDRHQIGNDAVFHIWGIVV